VIPTSDSNVFISGWRKVVLQDRIFFLVGDPEKKVGLYYESTFFQVTEPLFCHPQNYFLRVQIKRLTGNSITELAS
jgi:hypothetical protein